MSFVRRTAFGVLLSVALVLIGSSARAQYVFTRIADTSSTFTNFAGTSINGLGQVAFTANLNTGGSGVYRASTGATPTQLAASGAAFTSLDGPTTINAAGQVAFTSTLNSTRRLLRSDGTTLTVLADNTGTFSNLGSNPSLNGRGQAAFVAALSAGGNAVYLSSATGGTPSVVVSGGTYSDPDINGRGNIAFYSNRTGAQDLIVAQVGGVAPVTYASTSGGTFSSFSGLPSLNAFGTAVFTANLTAGGSGIYAATADGVSSAVATTSDGFTGFGFASNNASDFIVFQATVGQNNGLYYGSSPTNNKIVAVGDILDGSTVTSLLLSRDGLSDNGTVSFIANLADGRQGVYTAIMPEPSSFLLLGLPLIASAWFFRRRMRRSVAAVGLLVLAATLPHAARAQTLFVASYDGTTDRLGTINVFTGAYTETTTTVGFYGLAAADTNTLFAVDTNSPTNLYQVDAVTGTQTFVGNLGQDNDTLGLAFVGGNLYGLNPSSPNNLFRIDPLTATVTLVGATGFDGDGTLGIGPDGSLYATQGTLGTGFYRLDAATGAATLVNSNPGFGTVLGLGTTSSALYALNTTGGIFQIDLATGSATQTATYNVQSVGQVLAATGLPPVVPSASAPEPGSAALCLPLAFAALSLKRRRTSARPA